MRDERIGFAHVQTSCWGVLWLSKSVLGLCWDVPDEAAEVGPLEGSVGSDWVRSSKFVAGLVGWGHRAASRVVRVDGSGG